MKVYPGEHLPSSHSAFTAQVIQLSAHLSQLVPLTKNPSAQAEQAVLEQDVHEAEHVSQVLVSVLKLPFSHYEQPVSIQLVHLSEHLATVAVVAGATAATIL